MRYESHILYKFNSTVNRSFQKMFNAPVNIQLFNKPYKHKLRDFTK